MSTSAPTSLLAFVENVTYASAVGSEYEVLSANAAEYEWFDGRNAEVSWMFFSVVMVFVLLNITYYASLYSRLSNHKHAVWVYTSVVAQGLAYAGLCVASAYTDSYGILIAWAVLIVISGATVGAAVHVQNEFFFINTSSLSTTTRMKEERKKELSGSAFFMLATYALASWFALVSANVGGTAGQGALIWYVLFLCFGFFEMSLGTWFYVTMGVLLFTGFISAAYNSWGEAPWWYGVFYGLLAVAVGAMLLSFWVTH